MKKKRLYMKPEVEAIQVNATAILAGSGPQAKDANEQYEDGTAITGWE